MSNSEKNSFATNARAKKSRAAEIADTFEWLITAFILAFVFRAFIMEAFRIPTGSMADTLMGAHFSLCCPQCGYDYSYGFVPEKYGLPPETMPRWPLKMTSSRCPSCGYYQATGGKMDIAYGDRILVLKCLYQFLEPNRWDVIVFKNPLEPSVNYIKRLIGKPSETVEIIDGDIYINGQISRKPPKIQNELWMPVYDNDYQPVGPSEPFFNGHTWRQPFKIGDSRWKIGDDNPAVFSLDSLPEQINTLTYDTAVGNGFRTTYAYDDVKDYRNMPYCSDLMVCFYASFDEGQKGCVGVGLSKYQNLYNASVDLTGVMVITKTSKDGTTAELTRKAVKPAAAGKSVLVKFANVDHQLIFQFGSEQLVYEMGRLSGDAGPIEKSVEPGVKIFGSGKLALSHIAIFRDIYYLATDGPGSGRASQGNPFTLEKDEFFVLGDNSPSSADGRWWSEPGKGNNGRFYREGVVPRDYLVGKALFVYWPGGFKPFSGFPFPIVPNVGKMRFIYGGSDKNP